MMSEEPSVDKVQPEVSGAPVVKAWLAGAQTVVDTIANPLVATAWDSPSVLWGQTVASLCGHLARGAVWVVAEYLDEAPTGDDPDLVSAADYFAQIGAALSDDDHAAIRQRGHEVAAVGHKALVERARVALAQLQLVVSETPTDRMVTVFGGHTMRLGDYLQTRMVEQAVHLDDLAHSVDDLEVTLPDAVASMAMQVGVELLAVQAGPMAALRTLYRRGHAASLPVL